MHAAGIKIKQASSSIGWQARPADEADERHEAWRQRRQVKRPPVPRSCTSDGTRPIMAPRAGEPAAMRLWIRQLLPHHTASSACPLHSRQRAPHLAAVAASVRALDRAPQTKHAFRQPRSRESTTAPSAQHMARMPRSPFGTQQAIGYRSGVECRGAVSPVEAVREARGEGREARGGPWGKWGD